MYIYIYIFTHPVYRSTTFSDIGVRGYLHMETKCAQPVCSRY